MNIQVKGTFTKRKGFIYRTETFIQFGDCEEIIGSCILCNPGSARLDNKKEQKELEDYFDEDDYIVTGKIYEDDTIKQLIKILKRSEACKDGGRFLIHNIFTLRNGNMDKALKEFIDTNIDKDLLYKDYDDYIKLQKDIPWTLVGWGCKDNKALNSIKRQWLYNLGENKVTTLGYRHDKDPHYYHPLPRGKSKCLEYVDIASGQLIDLLEKPS